MSKTSDQTRIAQLRDKEENDEQLTAAEIRQFRAILARNPYMSRKHRELELDLSRD